MGEPNRIKAPQAGIRSVEGRMVEILKSQRQLLDYAQVGFVVTDVHSKIVYGNRFAERLFGYQRHEMEGQRVRILFLEEDLTYFLPNIVYLTLYKTGFEGEGLLKQKEGTKVFVRISTASFTEGGETFLTFSFHEVQRLKNLEREKMEMERWASLGLVVREIAHRIKTPVLSMSGYANRLMKTLPRDVRSRAGLERILEETQKLKSIIRGVEEYVLISRPTFAKEKVQEVVGAAIQAVLQRASRKGIAINLDTGNLRENESFFIDREWAAKALSAVLQNSTEGLEKARSSSKKVGVSLFADEENIAISISDKGEGISKKDLSHIFKPFFSTRPDHMGLGLTYAKMVMAEHAGEIRVQSQPRKGTTVTLIFARDRRRKVRRELLS